MRGKEGHGCGYVTCKPVTTYSHSPIDLLGVQWRCESWWLGERTEPGVFLLFAILSSK